MFSLILPKRSPKIKPIDAPDYVNSVTDCSHAIVQDYIDISPDRGKIVYYCKNCLSTFQRKNNEYIIQYVNRGPPSPDIPE